MSNLFTRAFWMELIERAVKTSAQFVIGAGILGEGADLFNLDWSTVGSFALTGAILSALTSLASIAIGSKGTPSVMPIRGE